MESLTEKLEGHVTLQGHRNISFLNTVEPGYSGHAI